MWQWNTWFDTPETRLAGLLMFVWVVLMYYAFTNIINKKDREIAAKNR